MRIDSPNISSKPHLQMLDALRGVAALMVVWYHLFECFPFGGGEDMIRCNYGYLAVDFFFLLSGFVIGYAYDDRWPAGAGTYTPQAPASGGGLTVWEFFRRRLRRLHLMVIVGAVIGALSYLMQGGMMWDGTIVDLWQVLLALVMAILMIPCWPGCAADVRGNTELFPLNGPMWSLWFEYLGNIIYALLLRRLSTRTLTAVVVVSGGLQGYTILTEGALGAGWSFVDSGFMLGMLRMLFPYSLGLLIVRCFKVRKPAGQERNFGMWFAICSLLLVVLLAMPSVGNPEAPWQSGLYIMALTYVAFPLIVWQAARCGTAPNRAAQLLGEMSYPLYAVHYPFMYLFYYYIGFPSVTLTFADAWPMGLLAIGAALLTAFSVRKWRF